MVRRFLALVLLALVMVGVRAQDNKPQIPNGDFETWTYDGVNLPNNWNSFQTATGQLASMGYSATNRQVRQSPITRPGSEGQYSCVIWARSVFGVVAQGNMTSGRVYAGSMTAANKANYNYSDRVTVNTNNGVENPCAMKFTGRPDSIRLWVRFVPAAVVAGYETAKFSAIIHDDYDYIAYGLDANDTEENKAHVVAKAVVQIESKDKEWQCITLPFQYTDNDIEAKYIQLNASTNAYPGKGTVGDSLYIDDIEVIYLEKYTLSYYVDGELYHTEELQPGDAITPLDEPAKPGYSFSGWSEIPEVMPQEDVVVTGSFTKIPVDIHLAATNVVTTAKYPSLVPSQPSAPVRAYASETPEDAMECYIYNVGADGYLNDNNGIDQEPTVLWTVTKNTNGTYIFKSANGKFIRSWTTNAGFTPNYASNQTQSSNQTLIASTSTSGTYKMRFTYTWGTRYFGATDGKVQPKQTADQTTDWAFCTDETILQNAELLLKYQQEVEEYPNRVQTYEDSLQVYNDSIQAYKVAFAKHYNDTIAQDFALDVTEKYLLTSDLTDASVWSTNLIANKSQHWSGEADAPYYEQTAAQWNQTQWSVSASQNIELPVGHYVLSAICRASASVKADLRVESGDVLLTEAFPTLGDTGRGIDLTGTANYSEGEYSNEGKGNAWERRFITFEVVGGSVPVKISVNGSANVRYQWMSICSLELCQVPEPTVQNLTGVIKKLNEGTATKAEVEQMVGKILLLK